MNDNNDICDSALSTSFALSFVDLLANYDEKIDPLSYEIYDNENTHKQLQYETIEKPNIMPYAKIIDLNHQDNSFANEIKPKRAIEIGLNVTF